MGCPTTSDRADLQETHPTGPEANDPLRALAATQIHEWDPNMPRADVSVTSARRCICTRCGSGCQYSLPDSCLKGRKDSAFWRHPRISLDLSPARTYMIWILLAPRFKHTPWMLADGWLESGSSTRLQATRELPEQQTPASGVGRYCLAAIRSPGTPSGSRAAPVIRLTHRTRRGGRCRTLCRPDEDGEGGLGGPPAPLAGTEQPRPG